MVRNVKGRKHSKYAPTEGNRYDGIYKVSGPPCACPPRHLRADDTDMGLLSTGREVLA